MANENTFFGSFVSFFKRYFDFKGRSGRGAYWFWVLWGIIITTIIGAIGFGSYTTDPDTLQVIVNSPVRYYVYLYGSSAWSLATFIPGLALAVRRLRDGGHSWLNLFWILLPVIGWIILIVKYCSPSVNN